jgi:TRAP-type mannitol/chloroaromatic compound transport system permease small subunit
VGFLLGIICFLIPYHFLLAYFFYKVVVVRFECAMASEKSPGASQIICFWRCYFAIVVGVLKWVGDGISVGLELAIPHYSWFMTIKFLYIFYF